MQKLQFSYDELNEREQLPADWKQGNIDMGFQRALLNVSDYIIMPLVGRPLYEALLADNLRNILTWNTGDTALANNIRFYQNAYYRAKVNTSNSPTNTTDWEASQMGFLYMEKLKPLMAFAVALEGLKGRGATFNSNNLTSIVPEQAVIATVADANRKVALLEGRRDLATNAFMAQLAEWNSTVDGVVYQLPSNGYRVSRCAGCACNYFNGYYECGANDNYNSNKSFQYFTNGNNWQQTRK